MKNSNPKSRKCKRKQRKPSGSEDVLPCRMPADGSHARGVLANRVRSLCDPVTSESAHCAQIPHTQQAVISPSRQHALLAPSICLPCLAFPTSLCSPDALNLRRHTRCTLAARTLRTPRVGARERATPTLELVCLPSVCPLQCNSIASRFRHLKQTHTAFRVCPTYKLRFPVPVYPRKDKYYFLLMYFFMLIPFINAREKLENEGRKQKKKGKIKRAKQNLNRELSG